MPILIAHPIDVVVVGFAAEEDRLERPGERQLLWNGEVVVLKNCRHQMERTRKFRGSKLEAVAAGHRVLQDVVLPENLVVDAELAHQLEDLFVGPEERVKTGLDPVPIVVAPRRHLATEEFTLLEELDVVPCHEKASRSRQTRQSAASDDDGSPHSALFWIRHVK